MGWSASYINVHSGNEVAGLFFPSQHLTTSKHSQICCRRIQEVAKSCKLTLVITTVTMTGTSSVGPISVNGAGDQRNVKNSELEQREPYQEGKVNSHNTDDSSKTHPPVLCFSCQMGTEQDRRGPAIHRQPSGG